MHSIYYAYDTAGRLDTVKEQRGVQNTTTNPPVLEYNFDYDNLDSVTKVMIKRQESGSPSVTCESSSSRASTSRNVAP